MILMFLLECNTVYSMIDLIMNNCTLRNVESRVLLALAQAFGNVFHTLLWETFKLLPVCLCTEFISPLSLLTKSIDDNIFLSILVGSGCFSGQVVELGFL